MRRFLALAGAVFGLGAATLIAAPPAHATVNCNGTATDVTVPDHLNVPDGATCVLQGVSVMGNVTVQRRARLITGAWEGRPTAIAGGLTADRAYVELTQGTQVGGATSINDPRRRGNRRLGAICGSSLNGNLEVRNASASSRRFDIGGGGCSDGGNSIQGNVFVLDNEALVRITGNTIGANLICSGNNPPPEGSNNKVTGFRQGQCAGF